MYLVMNNSSLIGQLEYNSRLSIMGAGSRTVGIPVRGSGVEEK
jgi:hypothetical protein